MTIEVVSLFLRDQHQGNSESWRLELLRDTRALEGFKGGQPEVLRALARCCEQTEALS